MSILSTLLREKRLEGESIVADRSNHGVKKIASLKEMLHLKFFTQVYEHATNPSIENLNKY